MSIVKKNSRNPGTHVLFFIDLDCSFGQTNTGYTTIIRKQNIVIQGKCRLDKYLYETIFKYEKIIIYIN